MSAAESQRDTEEKIMLWECPWVCTHDSNEKLNWELEMKIAIQDTSRHIINVTITLISLSPPSYSKSAFSAQWNTKSSRNRHVDFFFNSWYFLCFLFEDLCQNKSRVIEWKGFSSLLTIDPAYVWNFITIFMISQFFFKWRIYGQC